MRARVLIHLNCLWLLLIFLGCSARTLPALPQASPLPPQTRTPTPPASPSALSVSTPEIALLVSSNASVRLKRDGWKSSQPTGFGTLVNSLDLLESDSPAQVLCADLHTVKELTGLQRNPCTNLPGRSLLRVGGLEFGTGTRSLSISKEIPYVIHPRNTFILNGHPILRWNNTGATAYTVEIKQGAISIWKQTGTRGNFVAYPVSAPPLLPATDYLLVITDETSGRKSDSDPNKSLGFQVLRKEHRDFLEAQRTMISELPGLDEAARQLAMGVLYDQFVADGRGLWGEAQELLEQVAQAQPNAPAVQLRLGQIFEKIKLGDMAQKAYEDAQTAAVTSADLESQAYAAVGFWHVTGKQEHFDRALSLYEQLGSTEQADRLRKEKSQ